MTNSAGNVFAEQPLKGNERMSESFPACVTPSCCSLCRHSHWISVYIESSSGKIGIIIAIR